MLKSSSAALFLARRRGWTTLCSSRGKASIPSDMAAASSKPSSTTTTTTSSVPVLTSLAAAAAGILTVSGVASVVDALSDVPQFDPSSQRFDESTFAGRFSKMLLRCDPKLLLYSNQSIRSAQQLLSLHSNNRAVDDATLWHAKLLVDSAVNDQDDILPRPFRMSGYVPYNGPICVAMVASTNTTSLLFWSWVNQSQNALVNYFNRNSESPMSNETLAKSYSVAVGSALLVAFGLSSLIQKRYSKQRAQELLRYVAFPSAVVASSLNCYIVRSPEIKSGIPLLNERCETVLAGETSQVAARAGVNSTTVSRAILQAPVYFVPPVLLGIVPLLRNFLQRCPQYIVPVTTYLLLVSFGVGLPATTAIFPQISTLDASQVEQKFQSLRDPATNQPYKVFYYNKGL